MNTILYMVIPCYNEEEVLPETAKELQKKISYLIEKKEIDDCSRIVFVNDGSTDDTWKLIEELHQSNKVFSGINLSRNCGHQNALLAGLLTAKKEADVMISMDADLQDDIEAIDAMIKSYHAGNDIVYAARNKRETDTFFKRFSAESFYKLMNSMGSETVFNHADYRLMSKRAVEGLEQYKEVNLFLRGIVPMIGYPSDIVYFERKKRFAGKSKYPLGKMLSFAVEGITSLSIQPMRMITALGLGVFSVSILILIYSLVRHFNGSTIVGWTSIALSIWAIGGLILLSLGIMGEYIGKIYLETKERPRYIVQEFLNDNDNPKNEEITNE